MYILGLAAQGVHYLHKSGLTIQDLGFKLLLELGQDKAYISETLFSAIFLSFVLWTFHIFILKSKKIYSVLIWCRVLAFLVELGQGKAYISETLFSAIFLSFVLFYGSKQRFDQNSEIDAICQHITSYYLNHGLDDDESN